MAAMTTGQGLGVLAGALVLGCGPVVGHPGGGGSGDGGSGSGSGSGSVSVSSTVSPTATSVPPMTSSVDGDDDGLDDGVKIDFVDFPQADVGGSTLCALPETLEANIVGNTPLGDVIARAAVFAETGGGRCGHGWRVLVAADTDALAGEVARLSMSLLPQDAVLVDIPAPDAPMLGELPATLTVYVGGAEWITPASVLVMDFVGPQRDAPVIEALVTGLDPDWMIHGPLSASWCSDITSPPCP
jgi:hypothetical protein